MWKYIAFFRTHKIFIVTFFAAAAILAGGVFGAVTLSKLSEKPKEVSKEVSSYVVPKVSEISSAEEVVSEVSSLEEVPIPPKKIAVADENDKEDVLNTDVLKDSTVKNGAAYTVTESEKKLDISMFKGVTYGIDVSKYQGNIDWKAVATSNVKFVMIRCGYRGYLSGELTPDAYFEKNAIGAYQNGIAVGLYFYSTAINEQEAREEAAYVCQLIDSLKQKGVAVTFPIAYDFEEFSPKSNGDISRAAEVAKSKAAVTANAYAFLNYIKQKGYTPIMYCSKYGTTAHFDMSKLSCFDYWLAHYTVNGQRSSYSGPYAMWQYTNKGSVPGIRGAVDLDVCDYSVNEEDCNICFTADAKIYKGPTPSSETVYEAKQNSVFASKGALKNGFYTVVIDGVRYFTESKNVKKVTFEKTDETLVLTGETVLYSQCSENEKFFVVTPEQNTEITVTGKCEDLWYKATYQDKTVYLKYDETLIKPSEPEPEPESEPEPEPQSETE